MYKVFKAIFLTLFCLAAALFSIIYLVYHDVGVLNPKGLIALKERNLLVWATLLMLIVVLPILFFIFAFAWKYRAGNIFAKYEPNWDYSFVIEALWWGIPIVIVVILSIITWASTHELDPYKPLAAKEETLPIQVVALQWKWLFIYPEQNIATLNFLVLPVDKPVHFAITADAPMNSFWIPELSGQIFAMPNMRTELNIVANAVGDYRGLSANISGRGFAGMHFMTHVIPAASFQDWVKEAQKSSHSLSKASYRALAQPSEEREERTYLLQEKGLFDRVVMQYMMPSTEPGHEMSLGEPDTSLTTEGEGSTSLDPLLLEQELVTNM